MGKTGGGPGSNQYGPKGQPKAQPQDAVADPTLASGASGFDGAADPFGVTLDDRFPNRNVAELHGHHLDEATDHLLTAALWSSTDIDDPDGDALDATYDTDDAHPTARQQLREELAQFIDDNHEAIATTGASTEQVGHDFWLTRNGHGAGFWDRGYGQAGEELSDAAKVWGTVDLYAHDGQVWYPGHEEDPVVA